MLITAPGIVLGLRDVRAAGNIRLTSRVHAFVPTPADPLRSSRRVLAAAAIALFSSLTAGCEFTLAPDANPPAPPPPSHSIAAPPPVSVTVTPSAAPSTGPAPERATDAKCEQPGLALAVLFDRSGSMQGRPIEMARAAAKAAADGLHTGDYLEVIAFDSAPTRVLPMTKMGSEREKATAKIEKIQAGGGTQFFPALDMVYQDLVDVSTCRKHVVFLSDGMAPTAGIKELVQAMVAESITISTVGLGSSVDVVLLRQISDIGGGRFYSVSDPDKLPAIFAADVLAAEKTVDSSR